MTDIVLDEYGREVRPPIDWSSSGVDVYLASQKLGNQFKQAIARLDEFKGSVGDSIPTTLDSDFAKEKGLSTRARVEIVSGHRTVHCAPSRFSPPAMIYSKPKTSLGDSYSHYVEGHRPSIQMVKEPFRSPVKDHSNWYIDNLESALFSRPGEIVLVNPSRGTLWRAGKWKKKFLFLYSKIMDRSYVQSMTEYGQTQGGENVHRWQKGLLHYGGPNGKVFESGDWLSFSISPYSDGVYTDLSVITDISGVTASYTRTSFPYSVHYPFEGSVRCYNPLSVATHFGLKETPFFCITSYYSIDSVEQHCRPLVYLHSLPPYVSHGSFSVSESKNEVFDVSGPGTYFSRRAKIRAYAEFHGKKICRLREVGKYGISLMSNSPLPHPNTNFVLSRHKRLSAYIYGPPRTLEIGPPNTLWSGSLDRAQLEVYFHFFYGFQGETKIYLDGLPCPPVLPPKVYRTGYKVIRQELSIFFLTEDSCPVVFSSTLSKGGSSHPWVPWGRWFRIRSFAGSYLLPRATLGHTNFIFPSFQVMNELTFSLVDFHFPANSRFGPPTVVRDLLQFGPFPANISDLTARSQMSHDQVLRSAQHDPKVHVQFSSQGLVTLDLKHSTPRVSNFKLQASRYLRTVASFQSELTCAETEYLFAQGFFLV